MKNFRVMWEIDIEADSPGEAAVKALEIQRNPTSWAKVFDVYHLSHGRVRVDTDELDLPQSAVQSQ